MERVSLVGIISKPGVDRAAAVVPELLRWLEERGIGVRCDNETAAYAGTADGLLRSDVPLGAQLVIVLGGDGTLLSAARAVGPLETPIFPVNLGGLGFLTAISVDDLFEELEHALRGEHRVAPRRMIQCELRRKDAVVSSYLALNDIVVTKASLARMIDLVARVDKHFVCRYKADGLIVATPTGSTAYSLSAGGPIIFPSVSCFCLTPICPHMLTNRPVIVPENFEIDLLNLAADGDAWLTVDGQVGEPLRNDDHVVCRRSEHAVHLVRPPKMMFFDVLREKLKWGER
jgi:NAD+ kinase